LAAKNPVFPNNHLAGTSKQNQRASQLQHNKCFSKKHIPPVDAPKSAIPGANPKQEKTCPRYGRTAMQNFTLISKGPAEKSVTVQNE